jgi:hypothetical protein
VPPPGCIPEATECSPCFPACGVGMQLCNDSCDNWYWACYTDCGTIRVRAMVVNKADTSCNAVRSSSVGVGGTVHQFTPSSKTQPDPQTQSGTAYSIFGGLRPGLYTIDSQTPAQYVLARACWMSVLDTPSSGEGLSHTLSPADTLTWDLGYTLGTQWTQVQGGDVYASAT